jgi:transcriptional regulator
METMMKAIVGIEVELNRLEGKRKLSQNRDERDAQGVVSALRERGREALSTAVSGVRTPAAS